jgi:hypothetical protein
VTGESVEQAALRRAAREPVTDPRVVSALESLGRILEADSRMDKLVQERFELLHSDIERLDAENAELRDELLALSNRIESTNRVLASRTDHLA